MRNFDRARPGVGAIALGIAQGAYEDTLDFLYKHDLLNNQYVQKKIADMATEIEAARALIYAASRMIDSQATGISKASSFSKLYPSDIAVKVCSEAIALMGPHGTLKENHVEKRLRDAKITQIYEGTNEIQRSVIALELTRDTGKKQKQEKK
jgi:alkylation response protein AidB-like acyl-CoA dehydrogenase